jgi:hypothetical protein
MTEEARYPTILVYIFIILKTVVTFTPAMGAWVVAA